MSLKKWEEFNSINESINSGSIDKSLIDDIEKIKSEMGIDISNYINSIFEKYRNDLNNIIREKLPNDTHIENGNGYSYLMDINNEVISSDAIHSPESDNKEVLRAISKLQYTHQILEKILDDVTEPLIDSNINSNKNSDNE